MQANNTKIVKKANSYLVIDEIRKSGGSTVEMIVNKTGLSRPTVLNIIKDLFDKQLLIKSGLVQTDVGRQPVLYSINANQYYAIGVDFNGPPVNLAITNLNGDVKYTLNYEVSESQTQEEIVQTLIEKIEAAMVHLEIEKSNLIGIAVGIPAAVDNQANKAIMSRWKILQETQISEIMSEYFGVEVFVRNDVYLLSLAEKRFVNSKRDLLYIAQRTGVGSAIIVKDNIFEGETGNAGLIGHTTLVPNGRVCKGCGNRGCLEAYISKSAMEMEYQRISGRRISYRQLLEKAQDGDEHALIVCKEAGYYFGVGIANIIKVLDIHFIILGCLECGEKHILFSSIKESARENMKPFSNKPVKIIPGKLDDNQAGIGGCCYVVEKFFETPKLKLKTV